MASTRYDCALFENQNAIGIANGREPVCDDEGRTPGTKAAERCEHRALGEHVQRRGRLVEDQDGRIFEKARAMLRRWRCPPERPLPASPSTASRPPGSAAMKSSHPAAHAAARISSRVASRRPY